MRFFLTTVAGGIAGLAGLAVAAYLILCGFIWVRQARFIFFPSRELTVTPGGTGLPYEEVWLTVPGGSAGPVTLYGWWLPAQGQATDHVLLYLHGNGENIGANLTHAERFRSLGLSVLLFDYRSYGRSTGPFPSEQGVYADARAAWGHLTQVRQVDPDQIVLYGHSLGGAIAIDLALQHPDAAGLIVESSFTSIADLAAQMPFYRYLPSHWLLRHRFDSLDKVPQLTMPVLFIHGLGDSMVPSEMAMALYNAAPQPRSLWLVPSADHNNVAEVAGEPVYADQIRRFLNSLP